MNLEGVECIIQTDGGNEFTAHKFNKTINKHGYFQQITAPNSSLQNGMAEQPLCIIIKKRKRCMLYAVRLGTEFWVDALLHATWLYN